MKKWIIPLLASAILPAAAAAQGFSTEPIGGMGPGEPGIMPAEPGTGWPDLPPPQAQPQPQVGTGFPGVQRSPQAAGRPPFTLYQGSEASLALGYAASTPDGSFTTAAIDTRHTLWLAPFLGTQVDVGLATLDFDNSVFTAGLHVHFMPEGGERIGLYWLPSWGSDFDERLDNYGIEGIFSAVPNLTVEGRVGRFEGDASGPYFGARGFYTLNPAMALTASFQHTRLSEAGTDVNATDALVGAEYYMPGSDIRLTGGIGLARFGGDVPTETGFRVEVGATLFAFGQPPGPERMRTFGRQSFFGAF